MQMLCRKPHGWFNHVATDMDICILGPNYSIKIARYTDGDHNSPEVPC